MSSVLWCNIDSNDNDLYLAEWVKLGIRFVGDIVDEKGRLLKFGELKEQYSIPETSIYVYYRLRTQVKNYIKENRKEDRFDQMCPIYPFHVKILSKNQKGARDMYHVFIISENIDKILRAKWHSDLSIELNKENWDAIFCICHHTVKDNEIIWFQYRVLNRILGTNKLRVTNVDLSIS